MQNHELRPEFERLVLDWMEESRKKLDPLPRQEMLAAVCGLYAEIAVDESVQGADLSRSGRVEAKKDLGKHVIRATSEFWKARLG